MTTVDYVCADGHRTERTTRRPTATTRCGTCGKRAARQFPAPSVHFKGDGWTSYASRA